jgi:beta-phosphoglucomutase-like phosphatase (HAD superfamily)
LGARSILSAIIWIVPGISMIHAQPRFHFARVSWIFLNLLGHVAIPMAVATSTARAKAEAHLKRGGIYHNFDVLVTRSDVEAGKPHPETFLKVAELINVDPSDCLALEDSYNGVRAAAAAGMATIMIPDLLHPIPEIVSLCVGVLPSLDDVRTRISQQL